MKYIYILSISKLFSSSHNMVIRIRISVAKQYRCKMWWHVTMLLNHSSSNSSLPLLSKLPLVIKWGPYITGTTDFLPVPHWLCLWETCREGHKSQSVIAGYCNYQLPECQITIIWLQVCCNSWNFCRMVTSITHSMLSLVRTVPEKVVSKGPPVQQYILLMIQSPFHLCLLIVHYCCLTILF